MIFSETSRRIVRSEIRELLKVSRRPGVISLAGGLPDSSLFPLTPIADITRDVLTQKGYLALQYGPTEGEPEFVSSLMAHMNAYGDVAAPANICVTSSSQQGLDLLSLLFLDEGASVIMELPSYLGAIQAFGRCGARMLGVPMDDKGMDIDYLDRVVQAEIQNGTKPRFIYVIPDFQNPSGVTMSLSRRHRLIELARAHEIPIVEDSPYRELRFEGDTQPSLWTLADGRGVIMLKTFSKMLFPGMRMGWIVGEPAVIEKIVLLKQSVDLCTPSFNQLILAEYIRRGGMAETMEKAKQCYAPKSKAMLTALDRYMPDCVSWSKPEGGMFLWVTLPEDIDSRAMFPRVLDHNVAYVIGHPFHCDGSGKNTLRLNYSFPKLDQIDEGIKRLAAAIRESC